MQNKDVEEKRNLLTDAADKATKYSRQNFERLVTPAGIADLVSPFRGRLSLCLG